MLWTISHVLTVEDRLTKLMNNDYEIAAQNAWWDKLMTERPSTGRREIYEWLLTTAEIEDLPKGQMVYEELVTQAHEAENRDRGKGLKIPRNKWEDDDFKFAGEWAAQMGVAMALDPQYLAIDLLLGGETNKGYDKLPYFHAAHPVNPFDSSKGTLRNLVTDLSQIGGPAGAPELTEESFALGVAHMKTYTMPNGRNRNLKPKYLAVSPQREKLAITITGAKFIDATENVLTSYGIEPLVIPELAKEPKSWFLAAENGGTNQKPLIYQNRMEYQMTSYNGMTQAELNRLNELEWQIRGRKTALYGHPFQMIKFKVT
jgi:phage major head subunit gpT-like protein